MGFRSDTEILRRKLEGLRKDHQSAKRETEREEREVAKLADALGVDNELPSAREGRAFATTLTIVMCLPLVVAAVVTARAYSLAPFVEERVAHAHTVRWRARDQSSPDTPCELTMALDGDSVRHIALRCDEVEVYRYTNNLPCAVGAPLIGDQSIHYRLACGTEYGVGHEWIRLSFGGRSIEVQGVSKPTDVQFGPFPEEFYSGGLR